MIWSYSFDSIHRFLSNGDEDAVFQANLSDESAGFSEMRAFQLAEQPNGKIILTVQGPEGLVLARLHEDGRLDPTFGTNGKVVLPDIRIHPSWIPSIKVQGDKVLIVESKYDAFNIYRFWACTTSPETRAKDF